MRPLLILLALLLPATLLHAQQRSTTQPAATQPKQIKRVTVKPGTAQKITQPTPTPSTRIGSPTAEKKELSKEQQAKQEALYKASPGLKEAVEKIEAQGGKVNSWGNTDEAGMAAAGAKPVKPATGGNKKAAEAAYKRKDYQAALQQYKALAAEGDTEAALMLGIMHEKGEGVDEDPAAAYAWYGRAAQQGDPVAREVVRDINDKDQMKDSDLEAAGKKYEEISRELDETPGDTSKEFSELREETNVNTEIYERAPISGDKPADE